MITSENENDVWKSTETAPKDGEMFLVCYPRMMNLVVRCRWNSVHKYFVDDSKGEGLTHPIFFHEGDLWTEIPDLPSES